MAICIPLPALSLNFILSCHCAFFLCVARETGLLKKAILVRTSYEHPSRPPFTGPKHFRWCCVLIYSDYRQQFHMVDLARHFLRSKSNVGVESAMALSSFDGRSTNSSSVIASFAVSKQTPYLRIANIK